MHFTILTRLLTTLIPNYLLNLLNESNVFDNNIGDQKQKDRLLISENIGVGATGEEILFLATSHLYQSTGKWKELEFGPFLNGCAGMRNLKKVRL